MACPYCQPKESRPGEPFCSDTCKARYPREKYEDKRSHRIQSQRKTQLRGKMCACGRRELPEPKPKGPLPKLCDLCKADRRNQRRRKPGPASVRSAA